MPPFSGPILPAGGYWLYTFEEEGVYEVNCAPHEGFGMVMRLVGGDVAGPAAEPLPDLCAAPPAGGEGGESDDHGEDNGAGEESEEAEARSPFRTAYTVLTDPALAPERIAERDSVSWEEIDAASKRLFVRTDGFPPCAEGR